MSETTEEKKDDGRGDFYVQSDGSRSAIRQVLDDRKRRHNAQNRATREAAFRERAWQQALLLQCLCCYPIVMADTLSRHEEWCPAHALWRSSELQKKMDDDRSAQVGIRGIKADLVVVDDHHGLDPAMEGIEYTMATCPKCGADVPDHDGFGVLAHLKPVHADGCGYCSHPSAEVVAGKGSVCGICSAVIEPEALAVDEPSEAKLAAASGDRERIAKAFLAAPVKSEDYEVTLNALSTKDVKRDD